MGWRRSSSGRGRLRDPSRATGRPARWLLTAREILRWAGPGALAVLALKRLVAPVVEIRRWIFLEADLDRPWPRREARVPLEIRPGSSEDVGRYPELFRAAGLELDEVRRRLDRGDVPILALSLGEPVHLHWLAFSPLHLTEIGIDLRLGPGEVYTYGAFTLPEWRGRGILGVVISKLDEYKRARGCTRQVAYVRSNNLRSLRAVAGLEPRRTKTVWSVRLRGLDRPLLFGVTAEGSPSLSRPTGPDGPGRLAPFARPRPRRPRG